MDNNSGKINSLEKKFFNIENKIKMTEEALNVLQIQYEENCKKINDLEPKIGQKRKWWQMN